MSAIIDFNAVIFVLLVVVNIALCIKKVPIIGLMLGFLTIALTGVVFMSDELINVYFSYFLIVLAFSTMLINGLDFRRK